jgi:hypothetical protein
LLALPTLKLQSPANALAGFVNRPASSSNNSAIVEIITIFLACFAVMWRLDGYQ